MKFNTLKEANDFIKIVQKCKGKVILKSIYSDVFNLKSLLMSYIAADALMKNESDKIELDCEYPEDEKMLRDFLDSLETKES